MPATSAAANGQATVRRLLMDRFRCPDSLANFVVAEDLSDETGYFRLGPDAVCYGQCSSGIPARAVADSLHDVSRHLVAAGSPVHLSFDPAQVVENLYRERYCATPPGLALRLTKLSHRIYYLLRPMLSASARKHLQRRYFRRWEQTLFPGWPVDGSVEQIFERLLMLSMQSAKIDKIPFIWFWPDAARSCTVMTHDVETPQGRDFCPQLMDMDDRYGIKSSFQIVPEGRYAVSRFMLENIRKRGFEVNVHDLNHDGHLIRDQKEFLRRAQRINRYGLEFGALGFRSALMCRNLDWYEALDFSYDMSVPNTGRLELQQGGCCTVLPFFVGKVLELPLTTTQDYSLFTILGDYSIRLWQQQISLIREKHGLISFIVHPDYVIDERARLVYAELLEYLSELRSRGETWIALPGEAAAWWRLRSEMKLVKRDGDWRIEGKGSERARVAYAVLDGATLSYEFGQPQKGEVSKQ